MAMSGAGTAFERVAERIERVGPVPFAAFVEAALYGDGGFFTARGGAGRRSDFVTSPELGPLFGAVVAHAVDAEWERLGRPDPFVVVEAGAGRGALARAVLDAGPASLPALRYVCVERSASLRASIGELVAVEPAANVLGGLGEEDDDGAVAMGRGQGPVLAVLEDLPATRFTGVVVANELVDNLPFSLVERRGGRWAEVRVGLGDGGLEEVLVRASVELATDADRLVPDAAEGSRIPLQHEARAWLGIALSRLRAGRVVVVDYADTTPSLARRPWTDWVRTYRSHRRAGHPLDAPGTADITCEVALDQLAQVRVVDFDRSQAEWLSVHGVHDLVAAAAAAWRAGAHVGDLAALAARSRVGEGEALVDPAGLGAFRVLEWTVG